MDFDWWGIFMDLTALTHTPPSNPNHCCHHNYKISTLLLKQMHSDDLPMIGNLRSMKIWIRNVHKKHIYIEVRTLLLTWSPLTAMGYMTYFPPWSSLGAHPSGVLSWSCSAPKLWPSSWVVTRSASCREGVGDNVTTGPRRGRTVAGWVVLPAYLGEDGFPIVLGAGQSSVEVDRFVPTGRRRWAFW